MEHAFWFGRWQEGRIAFHEGQPNTFLTRHGSWLAGCRRILVPLCGKTEDLAYLAGQGHDVVGVELVEDAVRQFFTEHAVTPTISNVGAFSVYRAGAITVLAGITTRGKYTFDTRLLFVIRLLLASLKPLAKNCHGRMAAVTSSG